MTRMKRKRFFRKFERILRFDSFLGKKKFSGVQTDEEKASTHRFKKFEKGNEKRGARKVINGTRSLMWLLTPNSFYTLLQRGLISN